MYLENATLRGSLSSASTGSSHAPTVNATVPVGRVLVVRAESTSEPTVLTAGASNHHLTCVDTVGNVYEKVAEVSKDGSGSNISVAISMWLCKVTVEIPNGSAITIGYDATYKTRLTGIVEHTLEVPEATVAVAGVNIAHGTNSPLAVTLVLGAEDEITWLGTAGYGQRNYVITKDSNFTTTLAEIEVDSGNFDSCTLWGQSRQVQIDTQTWTNTTPTSSIRWGMILAAITVTPPDPPPPEPGTREVQADFETDTHAVDLLTTEQRPDAVAWHRRVAYTKGPVDFEDLSEGMLARMWRVRCDVAEVYLARANSANTAWEDEILLTTAVGASPIDEIDVAFDVSGRIVLVAQRNTGPSGEAQISLFWWNPSAGPAAYEWKNVGTGRSPRCVVDYFPTTVGPGVCPLEIDVQVFYVKEVGTSYSIRRIEQSSGYATEVTTVAPSSSFIYLQQAFRTTDRRVSLLYAQRNVVAGTWQYRRIDSKPYRDSLLQRPTLDNWTSPFLDLMQTGEQAWWASPTVITSDWKLRVKTNDDVDGIEVGASDTYPNGSLHPFVEQQQTHAPGGGIGAGFNHDFIFSIEHGAGQMSLVAFRARTFKVILGETCYSPWRYMVVPAAYPQDSAFADIDVNCDRDRLLDVPSRNVFLLQGFVEGTKVSGEEHGSDAFPFVCTDPLVDSAPVGWQFIGGSRNTGPSFPFPTHFLEYSVRRRPYASVDFTDEDGRYTGWVVGTVLETETGGVPPAYDWDSDKFPREFPDDGGLFPPTPPTNNIWGQSA